jgi:hypothetical protein
MNNKLEDIRDKDNHCYDALKYAMTFLDDLSPDKQDLSSDNRQFHSTFKEAFHPTSKLPETDFSDDWGNSWHGAGSIRELEG